MKKLLRFLAASSSGKAWGATFLIRLLVGWVFIFAGIRKFIDLDATIGNFSQMGIPMPGFMAPWVAFWEVAGGLLVLLGLLTRAGAIPLIIIMIVAIAVTKLPALQENLGDGLQAAQLAISLLIASIFLLIAGGGRFALDRIWRR